MKNLFRKKILPLCMVIFLMGSLIPVMSFAASVSVYASDPYLKVGETLQLGYETSPSGVGLTWTSSNTGVATVNSRGVVTATGSGSVTIRATYTDSAGTAYSDSVTLYVYDYNGLSDGVSYRVMNYYNERYMSLATISDANSTNVSTGASGDYAASQWTLIVQSDGRVQWINDYSPTGKALRVSGTNLELYTYSSTSSTQKFYICRINSGTYKGCYYIRYGSYYVAQNSSYNVYLATTPSSSAVWSITPSDFGYGDLFDTNYPDFDTTANHSLFQTVLDGWGYSSVRARTNASSATAYSALSQTDIFVFRGHGAPGRICFYTSTGVTTGYIAVNSSVVSSGTCRYIDSCTENQLNALRCVLYLGCSTGVSSGSYNLLNATYQKGAHFVLGTTQTTYVSDSDAFLKGFLEEMNKYGTIKECIIAGLEKAGTNVKLESGRGKYPITYMGDTAQYLS